MDVGGHEVQVDREGGNRNSRRAAVMNAHCRNQATSSDPRGSGSCKGEENMSAGVEVLLPSPLSR
jgi:hypothetical protein